MSELSNIDLPPAVLAKDIMNTETGYKTPKDTFRANYKWFALTIASMITVIIVAVLTVGA
jgi:hypothetical protein